jgi:hypothetical protein
MPMVGKKKFPYTEKGKHAAETYASAKGMKMHEKKETKKKEKKETSMKKMMKSKPVKKAMKSGY